MTIRDSFPDVYGALAGRLGESAETSSRGGRHGALTEPALSQTQTPGPPRGGLPNNDRAPHHPTKDTVRSAEEAEFT